MLWLPKLGVAKGVGKKKKVPTKGILGQKLALLKIDEAVSYLGCFRAISRVRKKERNKKLKVGGDAGSASELGPKCHYDLSASSLLFSLSLSVYTLLSVGQFG
jgi:hypothetical protein